MLSLILCLATVGLWVRSYFAYDLWAHSDGTFGSSVYLGRGVVHLFAGGAYMVGPSVDGWLHVPMDSAIDAPSFRFDMQR